jgi:hypothetical protein
MFNPVSAISAKGYARKGVETVGSSASGLNEDSLNQTQTRFYSTQLQNQGVLNHVSKAHVKIGQIISNPV